MRYISLSFLIFHGFMAFSQKNYSTYCNPLDIDYTYASHNRSYTDVSYRSGADPSVINFKGKYYMFVTRSYGYWMSEDMSNWKFIKPQSWYFNGSNAPTAAVKGDKVLVLGDPSGRGAVIETTNPELGDWKTNYAVIDVPDGVQDPNLFVDDDGRVYLYEESSNTWPIRGIELDTNNFYIPIGKQKDLFYLNPEKNGWERFGQDHRSDIKPFIEGPWMLKHKGKYYLEYGAPGTQWNVYADGVYTSENPLGPFKYAPYNPIAYKPGGFLKGAGHGSTVKDNHGNYWHYSTMAISVNYKFERRLGMYPAGFEENGQMYVNTAYGDYPHYLPDTKVGQHKNRFTGWMLLSYKKPAKTNSSLVNVKHKVVDESEEGYMQNQIDGYDISRINDEEIRSFWVAEKNDENTWFEINLGQVMNVKALQLNFQDFNGRNFGRSDTLSQKYRIKASAEGKNWETIIDLSNSTQDQPHAYFELENEVNAQYIRYENVYVTNRYLALSEFRVFGKGKGNPPISPKNFTAKRDTDRRNAFLTWEKVRDATGYVIYWGISSDKLNLSAMIYETPNYELRALTTDQKYYYQVEAFNENGISVKSKMLFTE